MAIKPDSQITGKRRSGEKSPQEGQALLAVAELLAAGLLRVLDRKSSRNSNRVANSSLDCAGPSGGDVGRKAEELSS